MCQGSLEIGKWGHYPTHDIRFKTDVHLYIGKQIVHIKNVISPVKYDILMFWVDTAHRESGASASPSIDFMNPTYFRVMSVTKPRTEGNLKY